MPKKVSTTTDEKRIQEEILATFEQIYKGHKSATPRGLRWRLSANINHAAKIAGIDTTGLDYIEKYKQALSVLIKSDEFGAIEGVHSSIKDVQRYWEKKPADPETKLVTVPLKGSAIRVIVTVPCLGICGFVVGDVVQLTPANDLRIWEVAGVVSKGENAVSLGRVTNISAETITLRDDIEEQTFSFSEVITLGRINPEPIDRFEGRGWEDDKRIKELRAELEKLGAEDDQILRCSERYRIEKAIFDLAHPIIKGDDEDFDDWSKWEEKGEAQ